MVHAAEVNTWPAIPRIRAHCLVETTLERCVQRLRGRMTEEAEEAQQAALLEEQQLQEQRGGRRTMGGLTKKDRTPSFYTSKSLVNLSGLSVSDPAPIQQVWYQGNKNSREHLNTMYASESAAVPPRGSLAAASKCVYCVCMLYSILLHKIRLVGNIVRFCGRSQFITL